MYRLNQFQPALYILVLTGIAGYALASGLPVVWTLGCGGVLLNWWLIRTHRFQPLPRLAANVMTIGALVFVGHELFTAGTNSAVLIIGEFLVVLQLVKLWEQRANRDYGQLLVLSLLLMVASAINSSSLLFGILFIVYLFISLYCCLLFHLKVEADNARARAVAAVEALGGGKTAAQSTALDQSLSAPGGADYETPHDEKAVARSMRRVTVMMATVAVVMAVFVFIAFPRGSGQSMLVPPQLQNQMVLTGFSEDEKFDSVARIRQNEEIVAYVELWRERDNAEVKIDDGRTLWLRGVALDTYRPNGPKGDWRRTEIDQSEGESATYLFEPGLDEQLRELKQPGRTFTDQTEAGQLIAAAEAAQVARNRPAMREAVGAATRLRSNAQRFRQKITLHPTGSRTLFAMPGLIELKARRELRVRHGDDGSIQTIEPLTTPLEYDALSTGEPMEYRSWSETEANYLLRRHAAPSIDNMIVDYARNPQVSGSDENGSLAQQLLRLRREVVPGTDAGARHQLNPGEPSPLDEAVARNIESHLRGKDFHYTLDITDAKTRRELDPFVWFLGSDGHRGHCEYFAGAMALMCQSLGIDARIVLGFRCSEFNNTPGAGYYIVRQSHAHAWVEVRTPQGWKMFDPTNSQDIDLPQNQPRIARLWQNAKHLLDFFEYTYAEKVIAYDNDNRTNLIKTIEDQMRTSSDLKLSGRLARLQRAWDRLWRGSTLGDVVERVGARVVTAVSTLVGLAGIAAGLRWVLRLAALRRRAARIGIEALPAAEQLRLARQLGFYDDLMQLLARHDLVRRTHQTPMEFSSALHLPGDSGSIVRRLTEVYYRVRFGRANLSSAQQQRLGNVIAKLEIGLEKTVTS